MVIEEKDMHINTELKAYGLPCLQVPFLGDVVVLYGLITFGGVVSLERTDFN